IFPVHSISAGNSPFSISSPNKLQRSRRKYSCLGKDKKLRESVSIPTNLLSRPIFERAFIWRVIPSFLSKNHHAEPYCIFPFTEPSLKLPTIEAINSLSAGFRL